ncbi:NUDIX domain-containing protein [Streptomyces sp. L7]
MTTSPIRPRAAWGRLGIIRNPAGAVLMTEKAKDALEDEARKPWFHPGGCVEENEPLVDGLVRSVSSKLGITLQPGRLLAVHHMYDEQHETHLSKEGSTSSSTAGSSTRTRRSCSAAAPRAHAGCSRMTWMST